MIAPRLKITKRFVITSSLFAIGLLILMFVALDIQGNTGLATLDQPVLQWFLAHRTAWLTTLVHILTFVMSGEVLLPVAALLAAVWYWHGKERWRPLLFAVSFAGAIAVSWFIKLAVARERPLPDVMLSPLEIGYSLPSIHTFGVAIFVATLGYLFYSRRPSRHRFWMWFGLTASLTIVAALTRLYLGYHWLTDTVASVGLTLIVLAIIILVDTHWQAKRHQLAEPKKLK